MPSPSSPLQRPVVTNLATPTRLTRTLTRWHQTCVASRASTCSSCVMVTVLTDIRCPLISRQSCLRSSSRNSALIKTSLRIEPHRNSKNAFLDTSVTPSLTSMSVSCTVDSTTATSGKYLITNHYQKKDVSGCLMRFRVGGVVPFKLQMNSGSTVTAVLFDSLRIYCANAGDSRAVLYT